MIRFLRKSISLRNIWNLLSSYIQYWLFDFDRIWVCNSQNLLFCFGEKCTFIYRINMKFTLFCIFSSLMLIFWKYIFTFLINFISKYLKYITKPDTIMIVLFLSNLNLQFSKTIVFFLESCTFIYSIIMKLTLFFCNYILRISTSNFVSQKQMFFAIIKRISIYFKVQLMVIKEALMIYDDL